MKLIDEKGRLFGKINIIDFLVVLILVCLMPILYKGHKIITVKSAPLVQPPPGLIVEAELNCKAIKLDNKTLKLIKVGDKEIDIAGTVIGEIVWWGESSPYRYKFSLGNDTAIERDDPVFKEVPLKIKAKTELIGGYLHYRQDRIIVNSPFTFKTDKYIITVVPYRTPYIKPIVVSGEIYPERKRGVQGKVQGKVQDKSEENIENIELILNAMFKDLTEDTLKLISVGDREIDKNGKVIAEILSLGEIKTNTYNINLGGQNFLADGSENKQVYARLRLRCDLDDKDQIYYKGKLTTMNSLQEFKTDKYKARFMLTREYLPAGPGKWIMVNARFKGIMPELVALVKRGDLERGPSNQIIAKIEKIISKGDSETFMLSQGHLQIFPHPFYKDMVAVFEIFCTEQNRTFYFKDQPVKVGTPIVFTTDVYKIQGEIIGLIEDGDSKEGRE